MKELKTLKDFEETSNKCILNDDCYMIHSKKLKAETVKELKMIDNLTEDKDFAQILGLYDLYSADEEIGICLFGIKRYLIWKFNIIEEDLK